MNATHPKARHRVFYLLIPFIVAPFLTVIFWLLGGGQGVPARLGGNHGLNTNLPEVMQPKESALNKLSFYAVAERDSLEKAAQIRMDSSLAKEQKDQVIDVFDRKLAELDKKQGQPAFSAMPVMQPAIHQQPAAVVSADIERLQGMMNVLNKNQSDPEIENLNAVLDKVLALQHPERQRSVKTSEARFSYPVRSGADNENGYHSVGQMGFYADMEDGEDSATSRTIRAAIHGTQILGTGSVIKFRLLHDIYVNRARIPSGTFIYGTGTILQERLRINITSIQAFDRLYPVALAVYDLDGQEGIYIPGSIGREVVKQSMDQGLGSASLFSLDPSIKGQALAAGLGTAKNFLSRKVQQQRVTVKAGYLVLLKDEKFNESQ